MAYLKRRVASHKILQFLQNNKVIFFFQKKSIQSDHWRLLRKKIAKIEGVASLNLKNKRDKREIQSLIFSSLACQGNDTNPLNSSKPTNSLQTKETCSMEGSTKPHVSIENLEGASSSPVEETSPRRFACQLQLPSFHASRGATPSLGKQEKISHFFGEKLCEISCNRTSTTDVNILLRKMLQEDVTFCSTKSITNVKLCEQNKDQLEIVERICGLLYAPNFILGSDSLKKLAHISNQLKEDSNLIFTGGWDGNQLINHLDSLKLLETPQDIWKEGIYCLSSSYARPYLFLHSLLEKRKNLLVYSLKEKMHALVRSLQERKVQQIKQERKEE